MRGRYTVPHHNQRLSEEQVEDIREEWSRKRLLQQAAKDMKEELDSLGERETRLRMEYLDVQTIVDNISHRSLAKQYGVSIHTINGILAGNTR